MSARAVLSARALLKWVRSSKASPQQAHSPRIGPEERLPRSSAPSADSRASMSFMKSLHMLFRVALSFHSCLCDGSKFDLVDRSRMHTHEQIGVYVYGRAGGLRVKKITPVCLQVTAERLTHFVNTNAALASSGNLLYTSCANFDIHSHGMPDTLPFRVLVPHLRKNSPVIAGNMCQWQEKVCTSSTCLSFYR
jgi:hypothetical protein